MLSIQQVGGGKDPVWTNPNNVFPDSGSVGDVLTKTERGPMWAPAGGSIPAPATSDPQNAVPTLADPPTGTVVWRVPEGSPLPAPTGNPSIIVAPRAPAGADQEWTAVATDRVFQDVSYETHSRAGSNLRYWDDTNRWWDYLIITAGGVVGQFSGSVYTTIVKVQHLIAPDGGDVPTAEFTLPHITFTNDTPAIDWGTLHMFRISPVGCVEQVDTASLGNVFPLSIWGYYTPLRYRIKPMY